MTSLFFLHSSSNNCNFRDVTHNTFGADLTEMLACVLNLSLLRPTDTVARSVTKVVGNSTRLVSAAVEVDLHHIGKFFVFFQIAINGNIADHSHFLILK